MTSSTRGLTGRAEDEDAAAADTDTLGPPARRQVAGPANLAAGLSVDRSDAGAAVVRIGNHDRRAADADALRGTEVRNWQARLPPLNAARARVNGSDSISGQTVDPIEGPAGDPQLVDLALVLPSRSGSPVRVDFVALPPVLVITRVLPAPLGRKWGEESS
jgi:hypothetical protein